MTKTMKEKGQEKKRLSKEINVIFRLKRKNWQDIDWTFLRTEDLRKLKKELEK